MKKDWEVKTLGEICVVEKQTHNVLNKIPFVGMEDMESGTGLLTGEPKKVEMKARTFDFTENHVLYGRLRPYLNKVFVPDFSGHCSTEIFPLKPSKDLDRRFLFYWLTNPATVQKINQTCTGARMPRANVNEVLKFSLLVPPLKDQQRIVKILDEKFEEIEKLKKVTEEQLTSAKELFESRLNELFDNPPSQWSKCILNDVAEITMGQSPLGSTYNTRGEGLPLINGPVEFGPDQLSKTHVTKYTNKPTKICNKGDLLICVRGSTTGRTNIAGDEACLGRGVASIVPRKDRIHKTLLHIYIASLRDRVYKMGTGATFPNVSGDVLKSLTLAIPPKNEQENLAEELDELSKKTKELEVIFERKITDLDELKKSYLKQAFSGDL